MILIKKILPFVAVMFSLNAYGFSREKCAQERLGTYNIFGISFFTTSFVSSFGGCAANGMNSKKDEILQFIAVNSESLEKDLARKSGEYLSTLQELAELNDIQTAKLTKSIEAQEMLISKNYEQFYEMLISL